MIRTGNTGSTDPTGSRTAVHGKKVNCHCRC